MAERPRWPTFIIGGAPRSGTTFLCHALDRHPDVYIAKPFIPEPKVFMGPAQDQEAYRARYAALFTEAGQQQALGEKTSYYLESEKACELIRATLPEVRLIFIVREPVARAYSNYLRTRKNALETLPFEEAVELEGKRISPLPPEQAYARPFDYLTRGDYATFAQRYYNAFGREAVRFFLCEEMLKQPADVLREIQNFIGVESLPVSVEDLGVVNSVRDTGPPIDPKTENKLRSRMAGSVKRFGEMTGLDLSVWGYD